MPAEGSIVLRVVWDGARISRASVRSTRSLVAPRLLEGKPAESVRRLISMLFSVCGRAQGVAAGAAIDAAMGRVPDEAGRQKRELLVAAESTLELMWRVVLDWPQLEGQEPASAEFARIRARIHGLIARAAGRPAWLREPWQKDELAQWRGIVPDLMRWLEAHVFGADPEAWVQLLESAGLDAWLARNDLAVARLMARAWRLPSAEGSVQLLPALEAGLLTERLRQSVEDPGFALEPDWGGEPAETGPLARASRRGGFAALARPEMPAARLLARLIELAQAPGHLRSILRGEAVGAAVASLQTGTLAGIAAVETARGILIHACRLSSREPFEVISYRIVAPTEWNFHPRGAFVRALTGYPAPGRTEAERIARLMAHALDPCVAYRVELQYA